MVTVYTPTARMLEFCGVSTVRGVPGNHPDKGGLLHAEEPSYPLSLAQLRELVESGPLRVLLVGQLPIRLGVMPGLWECGSYGTCLRSQPFLVSLNRHFFEAVAPSLHLPKVSINPAGLLGPSSKSASPHRSSGALTLKEGRHVGLSLRVRRKRRSGLRDLVERLRHDKPAPVVLAAPTPTKWADSQHEKQLPVWRGSC